MSLRSLVLAGVALAALIAPGCHDYDRNDPDVVYETSGKFDWRADLDDFSGVEVRHWDTYQDGAFVAFEAYYFRGAVRVEVFDDHGVLIHDRTYVGDGGDEFHIDATDVGDEGDWQIVITMDHVDGFIYVTLD